MMSPINKFISPYVGGIRSDPCYAILWFFVAVYPLIVVPNPVYLTYPGGIAPPSYFYAPRYVILIILATLGLIPLSRKSSINLEPKISLPLGLFLGSGLISTLLAPFPETAWVGSPYRFTGYSTYLACAVLFVLASQSSRAAKLLAWTIRTCAVVSALALLQYFGINLVPHEPFREGFISYGTMGNPNFLGTYTAFVLPAAMLSYLHEKRAAPLACSALIFGGLLASLCRGAWVASLATFLTVAFASRKDPARRRPAVTLALVCLAVAAALLPLRNGLLAKRIISLRTEAAALTSWSARQVAADQALSGRLLIWREVSALLKEHWAFGIGPDHLIYQGIKTPGGEIADKAHNIYLETAVTTGIFSLGFYFALLGVLLRRLLQRTGAVAHIVTAMIMVYSTQGFFSIDVVMILPILWIVLGFVLGAPSRQTTGQFHDFR